MSDEEDLKQKKYHFVFADSRLLPDCVYCGEQVEDRDHIPAKVFLNEPYPENLDVLNSCRACNGNASKDEEYVACVLEVVKKGTLELDKLRPKIARTLNYQTKLYERLKKDVVAQDPFEIKFDFDRFHNVFLKLAKGHAAHELNIFTFEEDCEIQWSPFNKMDRSQFEWFINPPKFELYPELGSRGMQRTFENEGIIWIEVQKDQYSYMAYVDWVGSHVRIHFSDYLAIYIFWPNG